MEQSYLSSILKQFHYYKQLGDKTFSQITIEEDIHWQYNEESNSIAIIVKHMVGNMLSRWTNFLTEDGEKSWRHRDQEFVDTFNTKEDMIASWENGWHCLFNVVESLTEEDLERTIYIRNLGHTVTEAINRQLTHYSFHVGQLVFLGKMIKGNAWEYLSIPKGESSRHNKDKFANAKVKKHFTDEL